MILSIALYRTEDWRSILFSSNVTYKGQENIQDDSLSNILNRFMQGKDMVKSLLMRYSVTNRKTSYRSTQRKIFRKITMIFFV